MDKLSPQQRHNNMAAIHGKDTKPEMVVRRWLWGRGFRYRLNHPRLPGKPDIVMRKYRTCIFVNGCFWHGHAGCKYFVWPESNAEFWKKKIEANISRDKLKKQQLIDSGWNVIVVWECQLKKKNQQETLQYITNEIQNNL